MDNIIGHKLLIKAADYEAWGQEQKEKLAQQDECRRVIKEAKKLKALAQERGKQKGIEIAKSEMMAQQMDFSRDLDMMLKHAEDKVCSLVMEATRKVIEDYNNTELISKLVTKGLNMIHDTHQVVVRANQETLSQLKTNPETQRWLPRVTLEERADFEMDQLDLISEAGAIRIDIKEVLKRLNERST